MSAPRERAKSTLRYYFKLVYQRSGRDFTSDMAAEIDGIVDDIVDAAVVEATDAVSAVAKAE